MHKPKDVRSTKQWKIDITQRLEEVFLLPCAGESVPAEEQFDKEKAKAEVQALDAAPNNDKPPPNPALSALPGVQLTGAEKQKYEAEMAKLYKELDDKVRAGPGNTPVHEELEVCAKG